MFLFWESSLQFSLILRISHYGASWCGMWNLLEGDVARHLLHLAAWVWLDMRSGGNLLPIPAQDFLSRENRLLLSAAFSVFCMGLDTGNVIHLQTKLSLGVSIGKVES